MFWHFCRKIEESNLLAANLFFRNFQNKNVELNSMISEFQHEANFFVDHKNSMRTNFAEFFDEFCFSFFLFFFLIPKKYFQMPIANNKLVS